MTYEEIYKRLQKGDNAEDIAAELSALMNKAITQYTLDNQKEKQKLADAADVIGAVAYFMHTYYPNEKIDKQIADFKPEDLIDFCDTGLDKLVDLIQQVEELEEHLKTLAAMQKDSSTGDVQKLINELLKDID